MNVFKITYIDDRIDSTISAWLHSFKPANVDCEIEVAEETFDCMRDYKEILSIENVSTANIIIIDDKLFEDQNARKETVTGEEIKVVLKKYYPFTETFVITQNSVDDETGTIAKYKSEYEQDKSPIEYYNDSLGPKLEEAIKNLLYYRNLFAKFNTNPSWDAVVREKLTNAFEGMNTYDELTKTDIDILIQSFRELERQITNV